MFPRQYFANICQIMFTTLAQRCFHVVSTVAHQNGVIWVYSNSNTSLSCYSYFRWVFLAIRFLLAKCYTRTRAQMRSRALASMFVSLFSPVPLYDRAYASVRVQVCLFVCVIGIPNTERRSYRRPSSLYINWRCQYVHILWSIIVCVNVI